MSYNQYINHWKNHSKDKSLQQCGFHMTEDHIRSTAAIAEESDLFYVETDGEMVSPIYTNTDDCVDFLRKLNLINAIICAYPSGLCVMKN